MDKLLSNRGYRPGNGPSRAAGINHRGYCHVSSDSSVAVTLGKGIDAVMDCHKQQHKWQEKNKRLQRMVVRCSGEGPKTSSSSSSPAAASGAHRSGVARENSVLNASVPSYHAAAAAISSSSFQEVVDAAPRIRVRRATDRARDQLADLAVLNERLAQLNDSGAVEARRRVEFLKRRRKIWQKVYDYVMDNDVECTLSAIEEANLKVQEALSEERQDKSSVVELKETLQSLQKEVREAHENLHRTQQQVEDNLARMNELKGQAATLDSMYSTGSVNVSDVSDRPMQRAKRKSAGLESSLELEEELKNQYVH